MAKEKLAHQRHGTKTIWADIGSVFFTCLQLNFSLLIGLAPIYAVEVLLVNPMQTIFAIPGGLLLSTPGLVAAYVIFRDHPALTDLGRRTAGRQLDHSGGKVHENQKIAIEWGSDGTAVVGPYFRAYRTLVGRTLVIGVGFAAVFVIIEINALAFWDKPVGLYLLPGMSLVALILAGAWLIALVLTVEGYGHRWGQLIFEAVLLCIRRLPFAVMGVVGVVIFLAGIRREPILVSILGTSILLYFTWANSRWAAYPLLQQHERKCNEASHP